MDACLFMSRTLLGALFGRNSFYERPAYGWTLGRKGISYRVEDGRIFEIKILKRKDCFKGYQPFAVKAMGKKKNDNSSSSGHLAGFLRDRAIRIESVGRGTTVEGLCDGWKVVGRKGVERRGNLMDKGLQEVTEARVLTIEHGTSMEDEGISGSPKVAALLVGHGREEIKGGVEEAIYEGVKDQVKFDQFSGVSPVLNDDKREKR
ncbi:hypothetical protein K1719_023256 [Acacia pycnantha]|nr:hypothetical protein K1719_023256 [Acacia pycnantha]